MDELNDGRKQELRALSQAAAYTGQSVSFMAGLPDNERAYIQQWISEILAEAWANLSAALQPALEAFQKVGEYLSQVADAFFEALAPILRKLNRLARRVIYNREPYRIVRWRGIYARLTLRYPVVRWYPARE